MIYVNAITGSNFELLFQSMVSNQLNLNQVDIYEFLRVLQ